jgi:hypothetical protein
MIPLSAGKKLRWDEMRASIGLHNVRTGGEERKEARVGFGKLKAELS